MATSYSYDISSLAENLNAMVVNSNGGTSTSGINFGLCSMCSTGMSDERVLPCSHSVCGNCVRAHLWSPVLVCPVCRYEHVLEQILGEYDFSINDHSSMEKMFVDLIQTSNSDLGERNSRRNFTVDSSNTATSNSAPTLSLTMANSASGYKRSDLVSSSGAIPKIRNSSVQSLSNLMLANNCRERPIGASNSVFNELFLQKENLIDSVKVPPLSPIVGGETRSPRMSLSFRQCATSPTQRDDNVVDRENVIGDIPCCYHGVKLEYYCTVCKMAFCSECLSSHKNHRFTPLRDADNVVKNLLHDLLKETQSREKDVENGFMKAKTVLETLEINAIIAEREIVFTAKKIIECVEERKNKLLENLRRICNNKNEVLVKQMSTLKNTKYHLLMMQRAILSKIESKEIKELIRSHININDNLKKTEPVALELNPHEDATIVYSVKLKEICDFVGSFGHIHSMAQASNTKVYGVCTETALMSTPSYFTVRCYDHLGERRKTGGDDVQAMLTYPTGKRIFLPIKDYNNGDYTGMFVSHERGEHTIFVTVRGLPILNSVQKPKVKYKRHYKDIRYPPLETFGKGPNDQTSLSRGWGVHCDRDGIIYITERDIHCVLVFGPDLKFIRKFGHYGDRDGEMNRPAGITVDIYRRIIVVDKDNHRIQIFNLEGKFIMRFGRRGSGSAEFQYPWDVDSNSKGQILVSDSRNHRVQLFDKEGTLLMSSDETMGKCNFKILEIPRGVCFDHQGNVLVVDFNNHHVLILTPQLQLLSSIGRYGEADGHFFRPQGIFVDAKGYIFIVESKNNRVQIFSPQKRLCGKITSSDKNKPFAPCDITMSPDGHLYVVDIDIGCVYKF